MDVRIIELGRVGEETRGNPSLQSPNLEVTPKTQRRNNVSDIGV